MEIVRIKFNNIFKVSCTCAQDLFHWGHMPPVPYAGCASDYVIILLLLKSETPFNYEFKNKSEGTNFDIKKYGGFLLGR